MAEFLARSPKPEKGIQAQTYHDHISEVMRLAEQFAEKVAAYTHYSSLFRESVGFAAVYHDLGKLDAGNQAVLRTGKGSLPLHHWDAGAAHLMSRSTVLANMIAAMFVYAHHIGLPALKQEQLRQSGPFRVADAKPSTDANLPHYIGIHNAEMNQAGYSQLKWDGKSANQIFMRMALSCLVDADHTDSARHCGNIIPEGEVYLEPGKRLAALDSYVANIPGEPGKEEKNKLRRQVYQSCRVAQPAPGGIVACDSPVGTGKTTAVMSHLLNVAELKGLRRIFVVLPFTNIIDQSVEVYRKSLLLSGEEAERVVAAHHHKAEFEEESNRAFSFLWNAPVTVTTAVQFFETLSSSHPSTLRKLHQVAGSAIFIDEAHAALPAHLWPQAWKWLQELVRDWGCYIVMASGSLTKFWELPEFAETTMALPELVPHEAGEPVRRAENERIQYRIKAESMGLDALCDWLTTLDGPCLIIMNTVQSAAVVARELARRHGRENVEHISTALAPIHRKQTISRIKARLNDATDFDWFLVATSCVEAGVDFSFKSAARELCSLVSTIQTAGRANRSGEYGGAELWGFRIQAGELLKEHPAFKTSADILAQMHNEKKVAPEYCSEAMKREIRTRNQGICKDDPIVIAEKNSNFPLVNEQFRVILSNTMTVIVDEDLRRRIENNEPVDFREVQMKSVSIYTDKAANFAVAPLHGNINLSAWTLAYDDFIGYMAGVLAVADFTDNCCI